MQNFAVLEDGKLVGEYLDLDAAEWSQGKSYMNAEKMGLLLGNVVTKITAYNKKNRKGITK